MGTKPAYNELITIHRRGSLDVPSLEHSLDELNRRHEIWRTTFSLAPSGEPVQIIHSAAAPIRLRQFDLRTLPAAERPSESARLAAADARAPFDLTKLPLWRAILVRLADNEYELHMNLHQLVLDGVTVYRILLPELIALYANTALPEPTAQYADFAVWQRSRLTPTFLSPHLTWWKHQLSSPLPNLAWPHEKPRPPVQSYNGATESLFLPADLVSPLRTLAESQSSTLFMALAAGFFTLLHRYTGQTDLILGMPYAARTPETERISGYFLNLLPIRVDLTGNPTFEQTLHRVRSTVLDALEHGSVPLLKLLEEIKPPHDPSRNPLFQIMMSLEPPASPTDPAWDLTQAKVSSGSTKMDMYLNLDTRPDGLMAPIMYNPDLFDPSTIRRMFEDWCAILASGTKAPDTPISQLELAAQPEPQPKPRKRLLHWFKK
jgi:hypothetical protein